MVAARAAATEWLRYWLDFMVSLLGLMFDPGVMLNRAGRALCQEGDTRGKKVRMAEKPHNGRLSRCGWQT
jgi:hypothetical protein